MLTRTQVEAVNCTKDRTYVIFMYECLLIRRPRNSAVIFFQDCLGTRLSKTEAVLILLYVRLISFSIPIFVEHCGLLATFSGCYACQSSWYHLLWIWFALMKPRTRYAVAFRCRCACIHPGHPGYDCSMISIIEGRKEAGLKLVSSRGRDIYAMLQLD